MRVRRELSHTQLILVVVHRIFEATKVRALVCALAGTCVGWRVGRVADILRAHYDNATP